MTAELFAPAIEVEVEGSGLPADVLKNILDVEVSTQPSAIDHFSLTLANHFPELRWTHTKDAKLFEEGSSVRIKLGYVNKVETVFDGEITSVSPSFPESGPSTVRVEGLSRLHWLDRGTKLRTFQDMTDKDIFEKVAGDENLTPQSEATPTKHRYLAQTNLTDFRFLLARARWLRFELLADGKNVIFRKAKEGQSKTYALVWGNPQEGLQPDADVLPLRSFSPALNAREPVASVVVRGQDSATGEAIEERASSGDEDASMGGSETAADVQSKSFKTNPEVVISDQPVASREEARELARSEYNRRARRLVTGRGASIGIPDLRSGNVVELRGIGRFSGLYYVTSVIHRVGLSGYENLLRCRAVVDRMSDSLIDLLAGPRGTSGSRIYGVVLAIVTNNQDPDGQGRVRVRYPWLAAETEGESWWARIAVPMAGKEMGTYFLPEVDDPVLVAFEHGDPRFPYVLGALWNANAVPPEKNDDGKNNRRTIKSRSGHIVRFDDTDGSEKIEILDAKGAVKVVIDSKEKTLVITAEKDVSITSSDGKLKLSGKGVEIESSDAVKVHASGDMSLAGDGKTTLKGSTVAIN